MIPDQDLTCPNCGGDAKGGSHIEDHATHYVATCSDCGSVEKDRAPETPIEVTLDGIHIGEDWTDEPMETPNRGDPFHSVTKYVVTPKHTFSHTDWIHGALIGLSIMDIERGYQRAHGAHSPRVRGVDAVPRDSVTELRHLRRHRRVPT